MYTDIQFKKRIMRRIYFAYVLRRAREPVAREIVVLTFLLLLSSFFVSLRNVALNVSAVQDPGAMYHFFSRAFTDTEAAVKIIFMVGIFTALVFFINLTRQVGTSVMHRFN